MATGLNGAYMSHPTWVRGLKLKTQLSALTAVMSHPTWVRGLKPEVFRTRYQLDKEENLDATVQKITDEWTTLKQGLVSSGQYVEAPRATSKADEQNDFIKEMQGYSERNAPKPE